MPAQPLEQTETALAGHQTHAVELRTRAAQLRNQAGAAREHALRAMQAVEHRRRMVRPVHEQAEINQERARSTRELEAFVTSLRREEETLRAEAALQREWFREQALAMLEQGWSREELGEIGFGPEFLAELGLSDHPALRAG